MKRLVYIIAFLLTLQQAFAAYSTPGTGKNWNLDSLVANSSGHFTYSGGSYFLQDTLIISQSDTIKVYQNSVIKMGNLSILYVFGTLLINPVDSAKITAADTNFKHIGIRLDSTSGASVLKKLIFEYGNSIYMLNCNILIDSCTIRFNTNYASGMQSGAIALFKANPIISHCKIFRNRRAAIVSGANIASSPVITDNLILENDTENGNYPQINLGAASTSPVIIRNNTIRGLYPMSGGISFLPIGSIPSLIIENNIIKRNRYGIAIQNANINAYINNNIIDSNNAQGLPMLGGSGINIYGNSTLNIICTRNMIRWNLWGVTVQSSAKPNFGDLSSSDTTDVGLNKIYNNSHNDSIFDFYYNVTTTDTLKAENNFWGTTIADSIEAHVWHRPDIQNLGVIDYLPYRFAAGIENSTKENPVLFRLFEAFPNPFNPATKIKYQLTSSSLVHLKIYDISGKLIDELVNRKQAPGIYEVEWYAAGFSSGIYFCRLDAGGLTGSRKLVLIK
ncbi:MAG: T9SS type A sorting domain-containing protein [Ignavibacteriae bacterium]|nr:T9SS type A sorting domain-containing protein [Ignavibacteriota bacterium]